MDMEDRERRKQDRGERRKEAESQRRRIIEQEKKRRRQVVRKQRAILGGAAVLLLLFIWGGVSVWMGRKSSEEQRKDEAALETAAKEQEKAERREKKQHAEEEMESAMTSLESTVEDLISDYDGNWSVYVEELEYENDFSINNQGIYPASLVKIYTMAATFANMEQVIKNETDYLGSEESAKATVAQLLENMIEISDNESYNELVRLQSSDRDFGEGCGYINAYLQEEGYTGTGVHTTLHPAASSMENDGLGDNVTCVEDCGKLLEKIYKGSCGSQEDSGEMLHLLLNQENTLKIPEGLPEGIEVAHKTGETSEVQHDVGIIYGESTDFILCIMVDELTSSADVYTQYHELTETVYDALN